MTFIHQLPTMILQLLKQHPLGAISLLSLFAVFIPYQSKSNSSTYLARLPVRRHVFPIASPGTATLTDASQHNTDHFNINFSTANTRDSFNGEVVLTFVDTFSISVVVPPAFIEIPPKKPPGGTSGQSPPLKPKLTEVVKAHLVKASHSIRATLNGQSPQKPPPTGGYIPPLKPKFTELVRLHIVTPSSVIRVPLKQPPASQQNHPTTSKPCPTFLSRVIATAQPYPGDDVEQHTLGHGPFEASLTQNLTQNAPNGDKPKPNPKPKPPPNRYGSLAKPRNPKPIRPKPKPKPSR